MSGIQLLRVMCALTVFSVAHGSGPLSPVQTSLQNVSEVPVLFVRQIQKFLFEYLGN